MFFVEIYSHAILLKSGCFQFHVLFLTTHVTPLIPTLSPRFRIPFLLRQGVDFSPDRCRPR